MVWAYIFVLVAFFGQRLNPDVTHGFVDDILDGTRQRIVSASPRRHGFGRRRTVAR